MDKTEDLKPEGNSQKVYTPETITDAPLPVQEDSTIRNTSGNKIVDELGLVSTNNFGSNSVEFDNNQSITSTTYTALTGSSMTINLRRTTRMLIMFKVISYLTGTSVGDFTGIVNVSLFIDGVDASSTTRHQGWELGGDASAIGRLTDSSQSIETLEKGEHTLELRAKLTDNTNLTGKIESGVLIYLTLGN